MKSVSQIIGKPINECITYYISKFKLTKAYKTLKRSFRRTTMSECSAGTLVCNECNESGMLVACDTCEAHYHLDCAKPPLASIPEGPWSCHNCRRPTRRQRDAEPTQSTVDGLLTQDELSVSTAGGQPGNRCVILPKSKPKKKRARASTNSIRYDCPKCDRQGLKRKGLEAHYGMKHGGKIDWSAVITYDVGDRSGILPKPLSIIPPSIADDVESTGEALLGVDVLGKGSVSTQGVHVKAEKGGRALQFTSQSNLRYDCPKCDRQGLKRKGLEAHYGMKHGGKIDWFAVTSYEVDESKGVAIRPSTNAAQRDEVIPFTELDDDIVAKRSGRVSPGTAVRPTTRHNTAQRTKRPKVACSDECTIATVGISTVNSMKIDKHQLGEDFKPKAIANQYVKGNR